MDSLGKKITGFFYNRKLAIILIILIILLSILGTHIPQKSQLKPEVYAAWRTNHPIQAGIFETIGFDNLFSSYVFIGLVLLLYLNTLFCTKNMLAGSFRRLRKENQFQKKAYISAIENSDVIRTEKRDAASHIDQILRSCGYNVSHEGNMIFAEKNRYGVLGIPLLHISILFIVLAAVYGGMGRMEGDMRLIEGQTLSEEHRNYLTVSEGYFFNENHQGFDIRLEKFYPDYKDETDTPRGTAENLVISENGRETANGFVYSNNLMTYKGYTFLGNVNGLAPLLILTNPDGTVYSGSYITASDQDQSNRYVASFDIGDTGLEGGLMIYMTAPLAEVEKAGVIRQEPIIFLKIFNKGNEIYDGTLKLNETVKVPGEDRYLGFYDVKYWSDFYVVRNDGTPMVYAGLALLTLSLMIIYFIVPKKIWIEAVNNGTDAEIYIGGRADKFRSLYDEEFSDIVEKIIKRLSDGTN
ncbi:MAG TPA: cytochrome c biogenesis protein ResB [Candidatus Methanoperedens sp.]